MNSRRLPSFLAAWNKGSRLRLVLSSPNSIYLEKNYNSGGEVAAECRKDARTAHVTLYQDADHPSHLQIPVVRAPLETSDRSSGEQPLRPKVIEPGRR